MSTVTADNLVEKLNSFSKDELVEELVGALTGSATLVSARRNERAEKLRRGKLLLKLRETLIHVKMDDEGDRIYLRTTNDADVLKQIIDEIDEYGWHEFMREKGDSDINIFEECRKANAEIATLTSSLAAASARIGELEKNLKLMVAAMEGLRPFPLIVDAVADGLIHDARVALSQTEEGREHDPDVAPCDDAEFGMKP